VDFGARLSKAASCPETDDFCAAFKTQRTAGSVVHFASAVYTALCRFDAKGYLLPDFCSGATELPGRFSEGLLLRRVHAGVCSR
jgi:hypothetical protein